MSTSPQSPPSATGYRESNSTADRALTILGMFTETRLVISANQVADLLSVARSTAYRYLQSLVAKDFLEEAPGGGFQLGLRVLELARLARRSYGLSESAVPIMTELADRFQQTVLLTRRVGDSIVCIEREEAEGQSVRMSYERGTVLPINAGASALVVSAWLPEAEIRRILGRHVLAQFTDATLTDIDLLVERMAEIKRAGFSITIGELDSDLVGLAVPVFGETGVVAGLSFVGLQSRVPESVRLDLIAALAEGAARLSHLVRIAA